MNNNDFDMEKIVSNIERVKKMKAAKQRRPSISLKPLKFETNSDDSPLKTELITRINEKNLIYSDLYNYCATVKNGDVAEGQKLGYNIISGLRTRHTMMDTTFSMLCDFLNLDICLVERPAQDKEDDDNATE